MYSAHEPKTEIKKLKFKINDSLYDLIIMINLLFQLDDPSLIEISISAVFIGALLWGWYFLKKNDQKYSRKVMKYTASGAGLGGLLIFVIAIQLNFQIFPYIGVAALILAFMIYPKRLVEGAHDLPETKQAQWQEFYEKEYETAMSEGIASFKRKTFDLANQQFIQALKMRPDSAEAWLYLGEINFARKRFPEAKTAFTEALSRRPAYPEAQKRIQEIDQL